MKPISSFSRFFSSSVASNVCGIAKLYFWPPHAIGKDRFHPAISYILKGNLGHIALEFKKFGQDPIFFSVWPTTTNAPYDQNIDGNIIKRIKLSDSLEHDIREEEGREPKEKLIEINQEEYNGLAAFVAWYRTQTRDGEAKHGGETWSIKSNCADCVYDSLRHVNLIVECSPKILPRTPQQIFELGFDKNEIRLRTEMLRSPTL